MKALLLVMGIVRLHYYVEMFFSMTDINAKMTETTVVFLVLNAWNCSPVTNNLLMYSPTGKN